jgi:hypothetical protein
MKGVLLLIVFFTLISCSTTRRSSLYIQEDQILLTRKYIGIFVGYFHTAPTIVGGEDLIWIKTTFYDSFGKISAYGKTCGFLIGDKIYLKPTGSTPDKYGNWLYQIENDNSVSYLVSDFRYENNAFTKARSL